jgi:predicted DNA-binding transcriptional regulator AlpA
MSVLGFLTVQNFCREYALSRATFYRLINNDSGPRITKIGKRTLISREAAEDWQARVDGRHTVTVKPALTLDQALRGYRR